MHAMIFSGKRGRDSEVLKESGEGDMEGFGGRKWKGEIM